MLRKVIIVFLLTLTCFIVSSDAKAQTLEATIHSKPTGGDWYNANTWEENRTPNGDDIVEISPASMVYLEVNTGAAGLIIKENAKFSNKYGLTRSLTVNGDLINNGIIYDYSGGDLYLTVSGNAINNGEWKNRQTTFSGNDPRVIGPNSIDSLFIIFANSFEILNSPTLKALSINLNDQTLSLNSLEQTLTLSAYELDFTSSIEGKGTLVLDGTSEVSGTVKAPKLIIKSPSIISFADNTVINSPLIIEEGATMKHLYRHTSSVTIYGDIENNGTINDPNTGELYLYISGNIKNNGVWTNNKTFLLWDIVLGATNYELNFSDHQNSWPDPIILDKRIYNITANINEIKYWRTRANINGLPTPWSEIKTINGEINQRNPVIIVPGIMGSWEQGAEVIDRQWRIDPILHTYDNLIEAMIQSGYIIGENLFIFGYDWRQDNVLTAGLLKEAIAEVKEETESEKVDIIAHSMGGLVSRFYIQGSEYENDVDKLIFLDTPHQGAPESYLMYEGAYVMGKFGYIKKYIFQIEATKRGYFSLTKYIKEQIVSVEQLLPVYDYLQQEVNNNWIYRMYPIQYPKNTFLENLNVLPAIELLKERVNITNIISSAGAESTLATIRVIPDPNIYDSKWMNGYPDDVEGGDFSGLISGNGDGTVPYDSLDFLVDVDIIEIADTEHREIVTKTQQDVIEILTGERPEDYYEGLWSAIKRVLFIRVYSPVDFRVIAPDGKIIGKNFASNTDINEIPGAFYSGFESEAEFVTIINPEEGDYRVELQGTDNGTYKLGIDILDNTEEQESTKEFTGSIQTGEEHNFDFSYDSENEDPLGELEPDDNISPEIIINSPAENWQYLHSDNLIIDYTVTDDFSGIATTTIDLDGAILSTTTIDLFYYDLGGHILNITAKDKTGNSTSSIVKFEIIANIDSAISDIEKSYNLGWIKKKYVKRILITGLRIIEKRLVIFDKQKQRIENKKEKIINNPNMSEKVKQKLIVRLDKRLERIAEQRTKFIQRSLTAFTKTTTRFYQRNLINQLGYDIIINNINYLQLNLKL